MRAYWLGRSTKQTANAANLVDDAMLRLFGLVGLFQSALMAISGQ